MVKRGTADRAVRAGTDLRAWSEGVSPLTEDMELARALLAEWQPRVLSGDDAKEGAVAFIERHSAVWNGG